MTILASGSSVSFFVFVSLIAALFTVTFHIISHSYNGMNSSVITRCRCCLVSMAVASSVAGRVICCFTSSSNLWVSVWTVLQSLCPLLLEVVHQEFQFPLATSLVVFYSSPTRVCFSSMWLALLPLLRSPIQAWGLAYLSKAHSP